ncbi:conserved hypothetical protein [Streptomyces sviceus ATCC 29083]|uniref:Uncharacterized protein n=1 Tax=Streptomyces sviceus (strain ATCC 29083 / DSM 924 / JCM 4929 / NBRC 13980 / NCIMB 11184 / NRRL 5439 / UC 5370) TaxID=463191 RepID=B5HS03_STRX2|nr:conserved hypothetical protein [Streptomyces sviceus ATCC 29083]
MVDLGVAVVTVMRAWPGNPADQMVELGVREEPRQIVTRRQRDPHPLQRRILALHHTSRIRTGLGPVDVHTVEAQGAVTLRRQGAVRTRHRQLPPPHRGQILARTLPGRNTHVGSASRYTHPGSPAARQPGREMRPDST